MKTIFSLLLAIFYLGVSAQNEFNMAKKFKQNSLLKSNTFYIGLSTQIHQNLNISPMLIYEPLKIVEMHIEAGANKRAYHQTSFDADKITMNGNWKGAGIKLKIPTKSRKNFETAIFLGFNAGRSTSHVTVSNDYAGYHFDDAQITEKYEKYVSQYRQQLIGYSFTYKKRWHVNMAFTMNSIRAMKKIDPYAYLEYNPMTQNLFNSINGYNINITHVLYKPSKKHNGKGMKFRYRRPYS